MYLPIWGGTSAFEKVYFTEPEAVESLFENTEALQILEIHLQPEQIEKIERTLHARLKEHDVKIIKNPSTGEKAIVLNELGKYKPITLMVKLTRDNQVENIKIMVYRERIGSQVRKRRFLRQFIGKTKADRLQIDRDIDGISGATVSSWSVSTAVKKALLIAEFI